MQESYLRFLISESKKFAKQSSIFDIVLYGSAVKGKEEAGDTDILIIFEDLPLVKRTEISQKFKGALSKKISNIDIKTISLAEFFESQFLARQAVLVEGYSLIHNKTLAERMGFKGYALFTYSLKNLDHNKKTKFTYALIGRNTKGMLKQLNASAIGKGAFLIPIKNSIIFDDFLKKWGINYSKKTLILSSV